jgi:hypothetical protein
MTWPVLILLLILWAVGYSIHLSGAAIHLLLVAAAIVFAVKVMNSKKMA